jgi:hypothetical protein
MTNPTPNEISVRDPLSDVTRKERRLLLGVSLIGFALVYGRLIPDKISALGIEINPSNQKSLLLLILLVTLYFFAAFIIYALADFIAWRLVFIASLKEAWTELHEIEENQTKQIIFGYSWAQKKSSVEEAIRKHIKRESFVFILRRPTMIARAFFEFLLPIVVGLWAIICLWKAATH